MPWSSATPMTSRERKARLNEEVDLYEFPRNKYVQVRYIAPFNSYAWGWIRIRTPKSQSGNKYAQFPKVCLDYDPRKQSFTREICPYRKGGVYMQQRYLSNFIVRDLQEDKPRRIREPNTKERKRRNMLGERWRIKDIDSKSWTPVRGHDMPPSVAEKLANLSQLNTRRRNGKKVAYDIADPRRGMDVLVRFNPKAKNPSAMWDVQRAEPTRLTREELNYLIYDLSNLESIKPESRKVARSEWRRIEPVFAPKKRKTDNKKSGRDRDRTGRRRATSNKKSRRRNRNSSSNRRRASGGRRQKWDNENNLDDLD
jgi:hypothetical protein